ncbi:MAG: hypothetical protein QM739_07575 [Propionivibrio sp.]
MMIETMFDFFLSRPTRLIAMGSVLIRAGAFLFIAGLAGRVATVSVQSLRSLISHASQPLSLSDLYPALPTSWVPETELGYGGAILIVLVGLAMRSFGKEYARLAVR